MTHAEPQVTAVGIVCQRPDGTTEVYTAETPEWYAWLANPEHRRLVFAHPALGRFILRH